MGILFSNAFAFGIVYENLYAYIASAFGGINLSIKKKHCGPIVILAPHHKMEMKEKDTILVFAPFATLCIGS